MHELLLKSLRLKASQLHYYVLTSGLCKMDVIGLGNARNICILVDRDSTRRLPFKDLNILIIKKWVSAIAGQERIMVFKLLDSSQ